jgi:hypothetical protein
MGCIRASSEAAAVSGLRPLAPVALNLPHREQVIMLLGVVVPIGWFVLKNKHSVQSAWTNIGNKRPH